MTATIHDLAVFRGITPNERNAFSAAEYTRVGLPFFAGCEVCEAQLSPMNAYPSKSGMIRCLDCVGAMGYDTAQEANRDIFGEEDDAKMDAAIERLTTELGALSVEIDRAEAGEPEP